MGQTGISVTVMQTKPWLAESGASRSSDSEISLSSRFLSNFNVILYTYIFFIKVGHSYLILISMKLYSIYSWKTILKIKLLDEKLLPAILILSIYKFLIVHCLSCNKDKHAGSKCEDLLLFYI